MSCRTFVLSVIASLSLASASGAQEQTALALGPTRGPQFLLAVAHGSRPPVPVDAATVPVLRRRLSLNLENVSRVDALAAIARQSGLKFVFAKDVVPRQGQGQVRLRAEEITVAAALTEVLLDAGVDVVLTQEGSAVLVARVAAPAPVVGSIAGRVTDAKTQTALAGATVVVQGISRSATTGGDGRYRIADVVPGTYTVRARYIGYAPGTASVTVSANQEATADFTLEKSAQRLDEVVTTGTVVPTEVKALPTPVTVVTDSDITLQRPHSFQELFRQAVPTAVSWDYAAYPGETTISVRGASTLLGGTGQMKIFVDGIEAATPDNAPIDPSSIERVEVIRGPQAAAIYGADAIGGVIQIFTKHGDPTLTRPSIDGEVALGAVQTPYAGYGSVLRQSYTATVRGGGSDVSYNFGAGYKRTGDYLPNTEISRQSHASVYGGMHFERGIVAADVSGRYFLQNAPQVFNPEFYQTGDPFYSKPFYEPVQYGNQTVGTRFSVTPTRWWQHTITVGIDRYTADQTQTQPRLTSPDDTLLTVFNSSRTKTSIGYNTSVQGALGSGVSGAVTAGFDHYSVLSTYWFSVGTPTTTGDIASTADSPIFANRTITNNTGYFAQVQLGFRDMLFLTGGLRAEQNTNFGDSLGTPLSPRLGLSYTPRVGGATLKLRGSWGRAIRAPTHGEKSAGVDPLSLANPQLAPERQRGWDAGVDAVFGARGSLSVTYYDQTADNLIQFVKLQAAPVPTYQYQNVGRIKNTGVEVEGTIALGPLQLKGQYGYARARVEQLAPNYTGTLRIGDQTLTTPKHTAGGSLTIVPLPRTTISAGFTYVGSWNARDDLAEERCFGGTGPCQATRRDYIIAYPGFVKVNATVSQELTPRVSGFVSFDNLTNNQAFEPNNSLTVLGRISTVGLRLHY